jgi:hypothetical protein
LQQLLQALAVPESPWIPRHLQVDLPAKENSAQKLRYRRHESEHTCGVRMKQREFQMKHDEAPELPGSIIRPA